MYALAGLKLIEVALPLPLLSVGIQDTCHHISLLILILVSGRGKEF